MVPVLLMVNGGLMWRNWQTKRGVLIAGFIAPTAVAIYDCGWFRAHFEAAHPGAPRSADFQVNVPGLLWVSAITNLTGSLTRPGA